MNIQGFAFSPATITIPVGTQVTWTNRDSVNHTVTSTSGPQAFNSGTLTQNKAFSFTFTQAGTYNYRCNIHPSITAQVIVVQGSGSTEY